MKDVLINTLIILALLLCINIIIYLGFALLLWNINPNEWPKTTFFFMCILVAIIDVGIVISVLEKK